MTPQSYIEECVKKLREEFNWKDIFGEDSRAQKKVEAHLTSSLNGLLELIEKEIEGRKNEPVMLDLYWKKVIRKRHQALRKCRDSALADLLTWLKSIK